MYAADDKRKPWYMPPRRTQPLAVTVATQVFGLVLSLGAAAWVRQETYRCAQSRFDATVSNAAVQVERRFAAYGEALQGLRAFFHAGDVSREAFDRFAEALDLKEHYPGFQVLNYAPHVPATSRNAFEKSISTAPSWPAHLRFSITPAGTRDDYHPFTLIAPLQGNEHLLGKDIAAVPEVRVALDIARDTGKMTTSGRPVSGVGMQAGFGLGMRLPVYRPGTRTGTLSERRAAYLGSVGVGVLISGMLAGLPGVPPGVRVRLFEGGPEPIVEQVGAISSLGSGRLMFDSRASDRAHSPANGGRPSDAPAADSFRRVQSFSFADRVWEIEVSAPLGDVMPPFEHWLPLAVLAAGVAVTAMLGWLMLGLEGSIRKLPSNAP
jgi:hypothetical protein